jgi:hypothetical protein
MEHCFNSEFILQALNSEKKLLLKNKSLGPSILRLKNSPEFDRRGHLELVKEDPEILKYLPNNPKERLLDRKFLLAVKKNKNLGNQPFDENLMKGLKK